MLGERAAYQSIPLENHGVVCASVIALPVVQSSGVLWSTPAGPQPPSHNLNLAHGLAPSPARTHVFSLFKKDKMTVFFNYQHRRNSTRSSQKAANFRYKIIKVSKTSDANKSFYIFCIVTQIPDV